MTPRRSTIPRLGIILLLLLVVSPVTAPFSTCDLLDLLGGAASPGGVVVHSKGTPDEPDSGAGGGFVLHVPDSITALIVLRSAAQPRWRDAFHVPLRI